MLTDYWFDIPYFEDDFGVDTSDGHSIFRIRFEDDVIVITEADDQYDMYRRTVVFHGPSPR